MLVQQLGRAHAMEKRTLTGGVDRDDGGAAWRVGVGLQKCIIDTAITEHLAQHRPPGVVADVAEHANVEPEPGQRDAAVGGDAAAKQHDRVGVHEDPPPDGLIQRDRPTQQVRHAGAADDAVVVLRHAGQDSASALSRKSLTGFHPTRS